MRVLCTCLPGFGHFLPMSAFARALATAGHEVAFATAGEFCPRVEKAGYPAFPAGLSLPEQLEEAGRRFPEQHAMPPGKERFHEFVPRMLAGVAAPPRAEDLVPLVRDWKPDVLVHDETELGGPVAATVAGIPYADHSVGFLRPLHMARLARDTLQPLLDRWDVEVGEHAGLFTWMYLDVCPPSLQSPEIQHIDTAILMRNTDIDPGTDPLPDWVGELPDRPTVYVSLGTVFNQKPEVFARILAGFHDLDLNVVATVGEGADPAAFGPQPDHIHVEQFIPQSALLPHCDVVVNQGGTAILPILAHGLPLLVLPQGANQFHQAELCVSAGAARSLTPSEISPEAVREAVRALLDEPGYRERAREIADEIEEIMPGPENAVGLLEVLAEQQQPISRCAPSH